MYIIPKPQSLQFLEGQLTISYQSRIILAAECGGNTFSYAKLIQKELEKLLGFSLAITKGDAEAGGIYLTLLSTLRSEEYLLTINGDGILLQAGSEKAMLYAVQTLRQIIAQEGACLRCLMIKDYPDIDNRGYYLDVTRGRIPTLDYLKSFADKLSYYKINQFQLYVEHSFLFRELSEVWRDDTPLTAEEILELDEYCDRLNIELVPSIATFGHLHKLLSTKSYAGLCELPDSELQPFSYEDRMQHHTIDASNQQSIALIKTMIDEYLPLFRSNQFNICADETFDLGKGKSKVLAEQKGVDEIYIDYVKTLCEYLVEKGKRPMFWGDIVCGFPEAIKKLPPETICLNWAYHEGVTEETTRKLYQAGATQYLCPGVGGWNQFVNLVESSYINISKMCSYAHKYKALGVLNTDWGDFGHINHPEFASIGLIYGAAFSWNHEIPSFEEINTQIAQLEFGDSSGQLVKRIASISREQVFEWYHIVRLKEMDAKKKTSQEKQDYLLSLDFSGAKSANNRLTVIINELYENLHYLQSDKRSLIKPYILAAEATQIFNRIGATLQQLKYGASNEAATNPCKLAGCLEQWFYQYKAVWRTISKESELYRLQEVILWYADELRSFTSSEILN